MSTIQIAEKDKAFLEKVRDRANLPDLFDARDITEVVFRTLRDLMTAEASERVAFEMSGNAAPADAPQGTQIDLEDLWKDTNPVVAFLSQIRPPFEIDAALFLQRIGLEAALPASVTAEAAVGAVFAATKDELSMERRQEVASVLTGKVRDLWADA